DVPFAHGPEPVLPIHGLGLALGEATDLLRKLDEEMRVIAASELGVLPPRVGDGLSAMAEPFRLDQPQQSKPGFPHRDHAREFFVGDREDLCLWVRELPAAIVGIVPEEARVTAVDLHAVGGNGVDFVAQWHWIAHASAAEFNETIAPPSVARH